LSVQFLLRVFAALGAELPSHAHPRFLRVVYTGALHTEAVHTGALHTTAGVNSAGVNSAGVNSAGVNSAGMNSACVNSAGVNSAGVNRPSEVALECAVESTLTFKPKKSTLAARGISASYPGYIYIYR